MGLFFNIILVTIALSGSSLTSHLQGIQVNCTDIYSCHSTVQYCKGTWLQHYLKPSDQLQHHVEYST